MFFAWGRIISGVRTAKILSLEWEEKLFKPYQHVGNTMLLSKQLGGGFKHFYFHPYLRRWFNSTNVFQMGWNHQMGVSENRGTPKSSI